MVSPENIFELQKQVYMQQKEAKRKLREKLSCNPKNKYEVPVTGTDTEDH